MAWPATAVVTGDYVTAIQLNGLPVRIADTTLVADALSIDFTSIPQFYAHLRIDVYSREDTAGLLTAGWTLRFNGDTGANYDYQFVQAYGTTKVAAEGFAQTKLIPGVETANLAGANLFAPTTLIIPHYAGTANNKDVLSSWSCKYGTATNNLQVGFAGGFWRSNAAITSIKVYADGDNFRSGSRATLYGIP